MTREGKEVIHRADVVKNYFPDDSYLPRAADMDRLQKLIDAEHARLQNAIKILGLEKVG